jgi:hypothetical protein
MSPKFRIAWKQRHLSLKPYIPNLLANTKNPKGEDNFADFGIDEKIILEYVLER